MLTPTGWEVATVDQRPARLEPGASRAGARIEMAKGQQVCHTAIRQPMHGSLGQFLYCEDVHLVSLKAAHECGHLYWSRLVWFSSGDRAPGASPGIPLRCAELAVTGSGAGAHQADQARLMSFTYTVWKISMPLRA